MPARKNLRHDQRTRDKIQCGMIIRRMQQYYKGEIEMSAGQIRVGEILLKKKLPDLANVSHEGQAVGDTIVQVLFGYKETEQDDA